MSNPEQIRRGRQTVRVIHLRGSGFDVVVDLRHGVPAILHWGAPVDDADATAAALDRPLVFGTLDVIAPVSVVPEHAAGFTGRPGLLGHRRRGTHWAPRFQPAGHTLDGSRLVAIAVDPVAELSLTTTILAEACLAVTVELTNASDRDRYLLDALTVTLPVAEHLGELLTFTGRWAREMSPQRLAWPHGARTAENRRGRTSHETPSLLFCGTDGFGEWHGEVVGAHLAWSGNHSWYADRLADGRRYLQLGELLHPGECSLEPGERYCAPEVVAVWSDEGLTAATQRFHRRLRARTCHPTRPRPVLLNTWEAVYFDHDLDTLRDLASRAAGIGVERFVLDDGWFGSRRDDTSGLGDWQVSPDAHPGGLEPLIDHVTGLGMEFGIWVEPEMVNPDSDLFRAHPDWALATDGDDPVLGRNQLVLDLGRPEAFDHVLGQLDELLRNHDISFVKWDMNRDHVAGSGAHGAAGTRAQTLALYRMLDELRARHPDVEFESCSSGGARVDHGILQRTERVWTSDCNDPLERQAIQRGTSMLVPPELMGAHIGAARAHTTGRRHGLAFRSATALFGHLGIEWDLRRLDDTELGALSEVLTLHRRFRPLLHSGDVVRFDTESELVAHGVYRADRREGLVSVARIATSPSLTPAPVRLPGLAPDRHYRIEHLPLPNERPGPSRATPVWWQTGLETTGHQLATTGVQLPALSPESAVLLHLEAR